MSRPINSHVGLRLSLSLIFLGLMALGLSARTAAQATGDPGTGPGKPEMIAQIGHSWPVNAIAYSPDGSLMATGGIDHKIKLWDTKSGFLIRTMSDHIQSIQSLAFTPDGQALVVGSYDYTVKLYGVVTGQVIWSVNTREVQTAISPDGRLLATGGENKISLRDMQTGQVRLTLSGVLSRVSSLAFSPDGTRLASGGADGESAGGELLLWDTQSGKLIQTLQKTDNVTTVAFSPDGQMLASGGWDKAAHVWNAQTGALLRTLPGDKISGVRSLTFSPDSKRLAIAGLYINIRLYDPRAGQLIRELPLAASIGRVVRFSPDGQTLACGDTDTLLYDPATGNLRGKLIRGGMRIAALAFSPDGQTLVTGNWDTSLRLWDVAKRQLRATPDKQSGWIETVAFSPDGGTFASGGADVPIRLWNAATGALQRTLTPDAPNPSAGTTPAAGGPPNGWPHSLVYAPDGSFLASADRYQGVHLWNPATGKVLRRLDAEQYSVTALAVSPDSARVAGVSETKPLRMWDTRTGATLWTGTDPATTVAGGEPSAAATTVVFSPDGKTLATAGFHAKIWDAATGAVRQTVDDSINVMCVAYSPDGKLLASGDQDGVVQLWDVAAGKHLGNLDSGRGTVWSLAFAPDSKLLAVGGDNATVDLWDAKPGDLAAWTKAATLVVCPPVNPEEISQVWLAFTPQMYYDCSAGADPYIWWSYGGHYYPASYFEKTYHRPDLLQASPRP